MAAVQLKPTRVVASASAASSEEDRRSWLVRNRSILLLVALVIHKCATDGITRWTRLQTSYSGATVAVMSEVAKFPLIAAAIASLSGGVQEVLPIFKAAFTKNPTANAWISLCYTFNNLLYFDALSALSAVAYQVLSQSKTIFTAGLMYFLVGKRLIFRQLVAIGMLIAGALLVQFEELARAASPAAGAVMTGAILWGVALTLFSSFISALPNVAYEKVLKTEGENQFVNNVQVTIWIIIWIAIATVVGALPGLWTSFSDGSLVVPAVSVSGLSAWLSGSFAGFTPTVWLVVLLKALNGLLIPATFKYADNILYSYAKPSSIVVMTLISSILVGTLPAPSLILGVALVVGSIVLYSSKPKPKAA